MSNLQTQKSVEVFELQTSVFLSSIMCNMNDIDAYVVLWH